MGLSSDRRLLAYAIGTVGLCAGSYLALLVLAYAAYVTVFADATVWQALLWGSVVLLGGYVAVEELRRPDRVLDVLDASPSDGEYAGLEATLTRLAKAADVPAPELWIAPVEEANSLTIGYRRPVVCVTEGLLGRFEEDPDRLEAVLAHEVAHVANRDARLMTAADLPSRLLFGIASAMVIAWTLPGLLTDVFVPEWFTDRYVVPMFVGFLVLLPVALAVESLADAFSRRREFAADRGAVAMTGDPASLAATLEALEDTDLPPVEDLREVSGISRFCIVSTHENRRTHPPVEARIERLRRLERESVSR